LDESLYIEFHIYKRDLVKNYILVCTSHKAKICGGGCCSDKGGDELLAEIQSELKKRGLDKEVIAKQSACLSNCKEGVSVKTLPFGKVHSHSKISDLDRILETFEKVVK